MNAGALKHRFEIYKFNENRNEFGEMEKSEIKFAEVWGYIDAIKGDEKYINQKEITLLTHKIVIRYISGIDESCFIKFKGRKFNINNIINPHEINRLLFLNCTEIKRGFDG